MQKRFENALKEGKVITLRFYSMDSFVETRLDNTIQQILEHYDHNEFYALIFTCAKELAINGLRANSKRMFFKKNDLNFLDEDEYKRALSLYEEEMTEQMHTVYQKAAKNKDIYVKIQFFHGKNGLRFDVTNNSELLSFDEKRLEEKQQEALKYNDLLDFYADHADRSDGMGIALITNLLKQMGIDPKLFKYLRQEQSTLARIEIPFNDDYKPVAEG